MEVIDRGWAHFLGLKHFYTGVPCLRGHDSPRYTRSRLCVQCDLEVHRVRRRPKAREREQQRRDANPERNRQAMRDWRKKHPDWSKAQNARRRGRKYEQNCKCCSVIDIAAVYAKARPFLDEVDHIVPLALGGAHCVKNLQILAIEDHRKKTAADNIAIRAARSNALLVSSG